MTSSTPAPEFFGATRVIGSGLPGAPRVEVDDKAILETPYLNSGAIAAGTVLMTLDFSQYRSCAIQCLSIGTGGVVTPEWSNDGLTWIAGLMLTPAYVSVATFNAAGLWIMNAAAKFLRFRLSTAATAGLTSLLVCQFDDPRHQWTTSQALAAGALLIGDVGTQYRANATGAASSVACMSPATPAATTIKAAAGRLLGFCLQNTAASLRSVKLFNLATPALGTSSAVFEIDIPANETAMWEAEGGLAFGTAMTFSVTSARGLTDNTATGLALNDVTGFFAFA